MCYKKTFGKKNVLRVKVSISTQNKDVIVIEKFE